MKQIFVVGGYVPDMFYVAMMTLSAFAEMSANDPSLFPSCSY